MFSQFFCFMSDKKIYTLYEVFSKLKNHFETRRAQKWSFFVKAEINKLNHYSNGNCYPELIWKENNKILARAYAFIPSYVYWKIQSNLSKYGKKLIDGMLVVFKWYIYFDELRWIKFKIEDLDIESFLWSLEKEKQDNINKLKKLWIFENNKKKPLPKLIQKIAVISISTSKWYNDFKYILEKSPYKINFQLFPASMQWEKVVPSIINQLNKIDTSFDVVVILRWWGSDTELVEFNNFKLAKAICEYKLPVLSAIGHSMNQSIVELVSNKFFITPTDLANFIVERFKYFDLELLNFKKTLNHKVQWLFTYLNNKKDNINSFKKTIYYASTKAVEYKKESLNQLKYNLVFAVNTLLKQKFSKIQQLKNQLIYSSKFYLAEKYNKLEKISLKLENLDINKLFDRWFSLVLKDWKIIRSSKDIKKWDILEIQLKDDKVKVKVI